MKLTVHLGDNSYPIYIENNILDKAGSYISSCFSGKKILIISDDNVFPLYGEKLKTSLRDYEVHELVLPHGEPTKAFETLPVLYNALLKQKFSRSDLVIALGGGVIGDLAGFAASSYLRGTVSCRFRLPCSHRWILPLAERLRWISRREKIW